MEEQHEVESTIPKEIVYNALEHSTGILQDVIQEEEERFYEIQGMVLSKQEELDSLKYSTRALDKDIRNNKTPPPASTHMEQCARMIQQLGTRVEQSDACVRYIDDTLIRQVQCEHARMRERIKELDLETASAQKEAQRLMQNNHAACHLVRDKRHLLTHYGKDVQRVKEEIYESLRSSSIEQKRVDEVVAQVHAHTEQQPDVHCALVGLRNTITSQSSRLKEKHHILCRIEKQKQEIQRETNEMQWYIRKVCEASCHLHATPVPLESTHCAGLEDIFHAIQSALQREEDLYKDISSSYRAACTRIDAYEQEYACIKDRMYELLPREARSVDSHCQAIQQDILDMTSILSTSSHPENTTPPTIRRDTIVKDLEDDIHHLEQDLERELQLHSALHATTKYSSVEEKQQLQPQHTTTTTITTTTEENRRKLWQLRSSLLSGDRQVALLRGQQLEKAIRQS